MFRARKFHPVVVVVAPTFPRGLIKPKRNWRLENSILVIGLRQDRMEFRAVRAPGSGTESPRKEGGQGGILSSGGDTGSSSSCAFFHSNQLRHRRELVQREGVGYLRAQKCGLVIVEDERMIMQLRDEEYLLGSVKDSFGGDRLVLRSSQLTSMYVMYSCMSSLSALAFITQCCSLVEEYFRVHIKVHVLQRVWIPHSSECVVRIFMSQKGDGFNSYSIGVLNPLSLSSH